MARLPDGCVMSELLHFMIQEAEKQNIEQNLCPIDVYSCTPFTKFGFATIGGREFISNIVRYFSLIFLALNSNPNYFAVFAVETLNLIIFVTHSGKEILSRYYFPQNFDTFFQKV